MSKYSIFNPPRYFPLVIAQVCALVAASQGVVVQSAVPQYTAEFIRVEGLSTVWAAINDARQFVVTRTFLQKDVDGLFRYMPVPEYSRAIPSGFALRRLESSFSLLPAGILFDINESGQAVGIWRGGSSTSTLSEPFLWDKESGDTAIFSGFFAPDVVSSLALNDLTDVVGTVGSSVSPDSAKHGFLYLTTQGGDPIVLPEFRQATDINNRRQIVGQAGDTLTALLRQPDGTLIDLGTLPGDSTSVATDINELGMVVGTSRDADGLETAFLWSDGVMTSLDPTGRFEWSVARAINDQGHVVGEGRIGSRTWGWLWRDGQLWTTWELVAGSCPPCIHLRTAVDINNQGDIINSGPGFEHVILLLHSPAIPEPSSLALLAAGATLVAVIRLRRWSRAKGGSRLVTAPATSARRDDCGTRRRNLQQLPALVPALVAEPRIEGEAIIHSTMIGRHAYFRSVIALAGIFIGGTIEPVYGLELTFRKVADTFTPIPSASGTFALGFYTPALDNGRVAFYGEGEELEGIYTDVTGVLARVADETTPLPGNFGELVFELEPAIDAGNIVFVADGDEVSGVYLFHGGTLSVIADTNTAAPDTTGNFESFGFLDKPAMHDGQVVFVGDGPDLHSGVYRYSGGTLSTVADSNTPVPNRMQNFESFEFNNVATHGGKVAFVGNWLSDPGVYLSDGGSLGVVADSSTAVPGDPGDQFIDFGSVFGGVDMDESTIAFLAASSFVSGIYRYDLATGQIATVVDDTTPVPGQPEEVFGSYFSSVSVSGGDVAFSYGDTLCSIFGGCHLTPFYGVYVNLEGTVEKVIAAGDVLDGRVVKRAEIGSQGFRDRQIAFWVEFDDGTEGIYVATLVPEPPVAVLGLIGLPVCLIVRRASRPKQNAPPWSR